MYSHTESHVKYAHCCKRDQNGRKPLQQNVSDRKARPWIDASTLKLPAPSWSGFHREKHLSLLHLSSAPWGDAHKQDFCSSSLSSTKLLHTNLSPSCPSPHWPLVCAVDSQALHLWFTPLETWSYLLRPGSHGCFVVGFNAIKIWINI